MKGTIIEKRTKLLDEKYPDAAIDTLLRTKLYPCQKEEIRFAAKAGKAIIADEMGLGKTVQAIGVAELLRREGLATSVLVLAPTSLKDLISNFKISSPEERIILEQGKAPKSFKAIAECMLAGHFRGRHLNCIRDGLLI